MSFPFPTIMISDKEVDALTVAVNALMAVEKINDAIDEYVQALVRREHGGIAQNTAFDAICEALGRNPTHEMDDIKNRLRKNDVGQ